MVGRRVADCWRSYRSAVGGATRNSGGKSKLNLVVRIQVTPQLLPVSRHPRQARVSGRNRGGRDVLATRCACGQAGNVEECNLRIGRPCIGAWQGGCSDGEVHPATGFLRGTGERQVVACRVVGTNDGVAWAAVVARCVVRIEPRGTRVEHAHLKHPERSMRTRSNKGTKNPCRQSQDTGLTLIRPPSLAWR